MVNWLSFYQNLPLHIDPTIFRVGFFGFSWYPIMYVVAFSIVYVLLRYRIKKNEAALFKINLLDYQWMDFLFYALLGVLVGGRMGYVIFYNLDYYWQHPLQIFSPYDFSSHVWIGIYGMSYHGGVLGVCLATWWFCRKNKINFWNFSDFILPAIPAGYFFGRIGNFLNGELYGRVTKSFLGMHFSSGGSGLLRYPSQLLEAFFEGIIIFAILWPLRNKYFLRDKQLFSYLFLYGLFRFFVEFFREPDPQLGFFWGFLTLGQMLCLVMMIVGAIGFVLKKK